MMKIFTKLLNVKFLETFNFWYFFLKKFLKFLILSSFFTLQILFRIFIWHSVITLFYIIEIIKACSITNIHECLQTHPEKKFLKENNKKAYFHSMKSFPFFLMCTLRFAFTIWSFFTHYFRSFPLHLTTIKKTLWFFALLHFKMSFMYPVVLACWRWWWWCVCKLA